MPLIVKGNPDLPQTLYPFGSLDSTLDSGRRENQTGKPQALEGREIIDQGFPDVEPLNDWQLSDEREIIDQGSMSGKAFQRKPGQRGKVGNRGTGKPKSAKVAFS